jgi:hypothetical protein
MRERRKVLIVERDRGEVDRLGTALEDAGFEVISCPGPSAPDYRCVGDRESYCPLVEHADVVVLDPWLAGDELGVGTTADALVGLYVGRGRTVVVLGSTGWLDPFAAGHVVRLDDRPDPDQVVAAVRSAPEATGLVLREI